MDDAAGRHIPSGPTVLLRIETEINIVEIRKIAFVEQADLFEHFAADHHARPGNPIGLENMIYDGRGDDPAFEQPGHQSELEVSLEFPERRSETKGRSLRRPVGVLQPTAGDPDRGDDHRQNTER